jgi:outer membrane protein insertion porin family
MKRTEQRLNNLGYFEKVNIQNKPGSSPDKTEIDVEVAEKSTGQITFGAGFSTADGPLADVGISENNFLGKGQQLRARTMFAAKRQMYNIGFTEPYFMDRPVEAGFDVYKTTQDYLDEASYNRDSLGAILRFSYSLSEKLRHQMRYNIEQSEISDVQDDASRFIKDQEGKNTASIVGHSFIYDNRDNRQMPTSGYYWRLNQDFAGVGGDDTFVRHEAQGEYYYPIAKKWTFLLAGSAGNITGVGEDVRINQRFYIGSEEVRGFSRAGLGARDITTDDALGGNSYYAGTAEIRFPLGLPDDLGVTGATFVDVGSLWGAEDQGPEVRDASDPRVSAGFGVAWASPFGPIRIDIAKAFVKQDYDEEELIRFSFGTKF